MKLDGYVRVSRVGGREGDSFISPEVQHEQIERWAALRDVEIAAWHTDLDQSGGKLRRPGLDAMMERIRSGETGGIAVAKLDRLSRAGVADALKLVEEVHDCGGQLAVVELGIDPTTSFGELAMTQMLAFARWQRRNITDSWAIAQERAVARGVHVASTAPTGYLRDESKRLVVDERFRQPIADIFRMRAAGGSWNALADHLTAAGVVSPYGSTTWHGGSVQHIIGNRVYLGEARSGRFTNGDAHEAIIDRATFEAAQVARGVAGARSDASTLLAGLLRCASCRYVMKADKMTLRDGTRIRNYRCRKHHTGGKCPHPASVLERAIWPHIEGLFFDADGAEADPSTSAEVEDATAALEVAEDALRTFRDDKRILRTLGQDGFVEALQSRQRDVDEARALLASMAQSEASEGLPDRATVEAMWPDLDDGERNHLLRGAFDAILVRPGRGIDIADRTHTFLRGDGPADFPRKGGTAEPLRPFAWPDVPAEAGVAVA
jgi:DNA invertase Pin-like site-specific DNA recombinase